MGLSSEKLTIRQLSSLWASKQESKRLWPWCKLVCFFFWNVISKTISHPVCQILFFRVNQWIQPTFCKRGIDTGANSSLVAQMVNCLPAIQETRVWSLGWEDPLEKEMEIYSSTLAWKIPWMEETDRLQSMGSQRAGHDWGSSLFLSLTGVNTRRWGSLGGPS